MNNETLNEIITISEMDQILLLPFIFIKSQKKKKEKKMEKW